MSLQPFKARDGKEWEDLKHLVVGYNLVKNTCLICILNLFHFYLKQSAFLRKLRGRMYYTLS